MVCTVVFGCAGRGVCDTAERKGNRALAKLMGKRAQTEVCAT